MNKVIYDNVGPSKKIPGIPYEDRFSLVRSIIFGNIPSPKELEAILAETTDEVMITPWSLDVVHGFRDYVPTTFRMVTEKMSQSQIEDLFGKESSWMPEPDRVLLQLQSELDAKSATIDAAIIHNRKDFGSIINKTHLINRIYNIGRMYGFIHDRGDRYPFLFGNTFHDPQTWDDVLISIKQLFIEFFQQVPLGRWYELKNRGVEASPEELKSRFVYVDWLKEKLGDNLVSVLLYGSAARTEDPAKHSDFDNWVRVKNVPAAQHALKGTCPVVYQGKVISGSDQQHLEGSHHLGIHLFPESPDYIVRFIRFLHDSREFLQHTKVLEGEFPFIKVAQDEVIERGVSQAYIKLKTIAGALNWAYIYPEKLMGRPALFEFIVKNTRFFYQHALNALEGPQLRTKADLNRRLEERGIQIPEYKSDEQYIKTSILYAMQSVLTLQSDFVRSGRQPNLRFLYDRTDYTWNNPKLNNWIPP